MQSRFINLTAYCIVEYMFEPLNSTNFLSEDFTLLENEHSDSYQIFNPDSSINTTRNIRDLTVVPIGNGKFAYLDSEKIPNYLAFDDKISETPVNGFNVVYDKVRFHFISGFQLDPLAGIILSVRNQMNDGRNHLFANIIVSNDTIDNIINFNPRPLFIGNATYDRFIDIKVPSIKNINEEFKISLNPATTFSATITPTDIGYSGFIYNNPINIGLAECGRKEVLSTNLNVKYDVFEVSQNFESSLSQSNEFDTVGAFVGESTGGDFIEYYLTFNSAFPEELISILNRRNPSDNWIIIHQLSVFEQIGSSFINTAKQVIFQEDKFDEPLLYRPVLRNAGSAVSMSIDLLCRLTNTRTGEQIIREASFSLLSPKKYGKNLNVIPLTDEPQSQKIYNKIIKTNLEATNLFIEPSFAPGFNSQTGITSTAPIVQPTQAAPPVVDPTAEPVAIADPTIPQLVQQAVAPTKVVEYVPVFFSNNNISIANVSAISDKTDVQDQVIFKQGALRFVLTPFDNAIRLKVYNVINQNPIPLDLNLNASNFRIVFETNSGKVSIDNQNDPSTENLSVGEVLFIVKKSNSSEIVNSTNRTVYLTSVAKDGTETLLYSGQWRLVSEQADVDQAIEAARAEAEKRNKTEDIIKKVEEKIDKLNVELNLKKPAVENLNPIKKKAIPGVVNRIGVPNPKKIKTDTNNSGSKSNK